MIGDTQAMDSMIATLRDESRNARVEVSSTWGTFGASSSKAAAISLLDQVDKRIASLAGTTYTQVINGQKTLSTFEQYAKEIHNTISTTVDDIGEWSFSGVASSTLNATVDDVKKVATIAGLISLPIILLAVGAYLFFFLGVGRR